MKYKIVFDPKRKIFKAIAKGKHPAIPQLTDKEVKQMNGGKAPKFPKNMPPSGSTWGVINASDKTPIYLIPKPITELGPKNGRITGRDSKGKPIYGGYYKISPHTNNGGLKEIINSDEFKEINEQYKQKGFEVLSQTPVLVDIKTGKIIKTESRTVHTKTSRKHIEIHGDEEYSKKQTFRLSWDEGDRSPVSLRTDDLYRLIVQIKKLGVSGDWADVYYDGALIGKLSMDYKIMEDTPFLWNNRVEADLPEALGDFLDPDGEAPSFREFASTGTDPMTETYAYLDYKPKPRRN